jgi:hypothetical protein
MGERTRDAGTALTGLTRAGLWYIYSATPVFWAMVARSFGLRIEPSDWELETLRAAESDAAGAVRFVPVPLAVTTAVVVLSGWSRPAFARFLNTFADESFIALVRSEPMQALGHTAGENAAVAIVTVAVWVLSMASVLVAFAPVWLVFRHQMLVAAPVVSVALASPVEGPAMPDAMPADYPHVRYALGKLQARPVRMRRGRPPA